MTSLEECAQTVKASAYFNLLVEGGGILITQDAICSEGPFDIINDWRVKFIPGLSLDRVDDRFNLALLAVVDRSSQGAVCQEKRHKDGFCSGEHLGTALLFQGAVVGIRAREIDWKGWGV